MKADKQHTRYLNVKDFPEELYRKMRLYCVNHNTHIREFLVDAVKHELSGERVKTEEPVKELIIEA